MKSNKTNFTSIDEYIAGFPEGTQKALREICAAIKGLVPETEEHISYKMPAFR